MILVKNTRLWYNVYCKEGDFMKAVSVFLEELQKRIDSTALQTIDFENKKNTLLEIDNIILKYGLNKRNISADDLLKIDSVSIDDLYLIIDFIYGNNTDEIKDIATRNINNIRNNDNHGSYVYLEQIAGRITQDLSSCLKRDKEYIDSQREMIELPKRVLELFDDGSLKRPIYDYSDIDKLSLGLSSKERGELKEELYIESFNLVAHQMSKDDKLFIDKYASVIKNKKEKYKDVYDVLTDVSADASLISQKAKEISKDKKFDYNDVRQVLFIKVLEDDLKKYQELLLSLGVRDGVYDNLLNLKSEMEEVLSLSRKKEVVTDGKEEDSSDKFREFDEVINKAKEIISSEKELIDSVKPEDLQKFLIDSVTSDDKDNKYKIVSILMELSREVNGALDKVKLFDGHLDDSVLSSFINNINKYIETYEVLKGDRNEENKEEHVIYLESIIDEVNALDKKELNAFKKVCEKLILGDFSEVKRLENTSYNIYVSSYKDVNVSFMRLPDKFLMILHVYTSEDEFDDMDEMFIKEVLLDKEKVFASQSELRCKLKVVINRSA